MLGEQLAGGVLRGTFAVDVEHHIRARLQAGGHQQRGRGQDRQLLGREPRDDGDPSHRPGRHLATRGGIDAGEPGADRAGRQPEPECVRDGVGRAAGGERHAPARVQPGRAREQLREHVGREPALERAGSIVYAQVHEARRGERLDEVREHWIGRQHGNPAAHQLRSAAGGLLARAAPVGQLDLRHLARLRGQRAVGRHDRRAPAAATEGAGELDHLQLHPAVGEGGNDEQPRVGWSHTPSRTRQALQPRRLTTRVPSKVTTSTKYRSP